MSRKKIAFLAWTAVVVAGYISGGLLATRDRVYTGTELEFKTGRSFQIEAESVTLEAASSDFFVLRKESGETIVGVPTQAPLGWTYDEYFVYGPEKVPGGEWLFPEGYATFRVTSENAVTIRLVNPPPLVGWLLLLAYFLLIWVLGLRLGSLL